MASAAYQVEGAVKDEGRAPSIWDVLTHRIADFVANNSTVGYFFSSLILLTRLRKATYPASLLNRRH